MQSALAIIATLNATLSTTVSHFTKQKMMFVKILFVGLIVGVEFSGTSRIGKWLPLNSKRSLLRDLMHPHRKHVLNHRGLGRYAQTELVIGSTSGTIGQDEQECLRDHHVTIWNAESQAGTYYKRICQQNRSVPSASAPTDNDYDPTIKTSEVDPQFKIIKEGYSVTLMCNVNTSSTFAWARTKPFDKIQNIDSTTRDSQYEVMENNYRNISELTIKKITDDYSGTYVCHAKQLDGQMIQRFQYELQTIVAPTITDIKVNNSSIGRRSLLEFKEFSPLNISCEADGSPLPDVNWRRTTNRDNDVVYMNASMLIFPNLTRRHGGIYTCKAWNQAGDSNRTVKISVLYKPVITTTADQDVRVGMKEEIPIFCRNHGNPNPNNTTWYKNGVPFTKTMWMTDVSLLVAIETNDDYGDYMCVVSNSQGKTSRTYTISGRPKMPTILSGNTTKKWSEYHLRWKTGDHFVIVRHFIIRVVQIGTNETNDFSGDYEVQRILYPFPSSTRRHFSLRIQALRRSTTYKIYVTPYIEGDVAGDEATITIRTPPEDTVDPPVTEFCSGSSTQPKVLPPQELASPGNGVGPTLTNASLVVATILINFIIIGCL